MTGNAGVFDFYKIVYQATEEDEENYRSHMPSAYETKKNGEPRTERGKTIYYRSYWRTHQMSDHLPMWVEIKNRLLR